mgnify:FL=1
MSAALGNVPLIDAINLKNPDSNVYFELLRAFPKGCYKKDYKSGQSCLERSIRAGIPEAVTCIMIKMYDQALHNISSKLLDIALSQNVVSKLISLFTHIV